MNPESVIHVKNLSKSYDIYRTPQDYLREMLTRKTRHDVFWALRDVSFDVFEKQRVGIIGPNGAGKSTLLRMLTGNLQPTSGELQVNGKVSALLSMASSLNPDDSGLENIKFNLLLNGVPKARINELTEDIIEFAELGDFIYSPVKTYSSGMNARLAFGIATAMEPEILVVDEVLSVGDGYFLGKAYKRMMELVERGKALIFVSHSVSEVRKLCNTAIWLENGIIRMHAEAEYVCTQYENDYYRKRDETERTENIQQAQKERNKLVKDYFIGHIYQPLRLVSDNEKNIFLDSHYIRSLTVSDAQLNKNQVELKSLETGEGKVTLDVFNSEWGRVSSHDGNECRVLSNRTGKFRGGVFFLPLSNMPSEHAKLLCEIEIETASINQKENLALEFIDLDTERWEKAKIILSEKIDKHWTRVRYQCQFAHPSKEKYERLLEKVAEGDKKDIEILEGCLLVDQEKAFTVRERQPFEITITAVANRKVPTADILLHIIRSDGVYVFWQSSGMVDKNLMDVSGRILVSFRFDPNIFGAGEYIVNVLCGNGWDVANNYPHKRIYDQKYGLFGFAVHKEYNIGLLDFGVLNVRVPVTFSSPVNEV